MSCPHHTVTGPPNGNFWLHSSDDGYDLTHPPSPDAPKICPRVTLQTTTAQVTVDPAKTALVIIDMQNFFLSHNLGRSRESNGLRACESLLRSAIPACRKAGIRIIWLNWGLTDEDIQHMPPATLKSFGAGKAQVDEPSEPKVPSSGPVGNNSGRAPAQRKNDVYTGLGSDIGPVQLDDGSTVQGGRLLMRDQWNSQLYQPLEQARWEGRREACKREDIWIHKNRMSGLWGGETPCSRYLQDNGIRTLLFAGVNTDQCVGGSLQDAFTKGYDCLLLSDGCGTTSPDHAKQCIEYNAAKLWGFILSCQDLAQSVENMIYS